MPEPKKTSGRPQFKDFATKEGLGGQEAKLPPNVTIGASSQAPSRFNDVYDKVEHVWNPKYVFPPGYRLRLHMTETKPSLLKPVRWRVESPTNAFSAVDVVDTGLPISPFGAPGVSVDVPSPGPLKITVRRGDDAPKTIEFNLKDYLVVSIGDSFSSGQGNPDQPGVPNAAARAVCELTTLVLLVDKFHEALGKVPVLREAVDVLEEAGEFLADIFTGGEATPSMDPPPVWLEPLAWRSLKSAPSLASRSVTQPSFGRLVTFVSVATSGAEIDSGLLKPQKKFQQVGQIDEVSRMLRNSRRFDRPLDVLIMSIGGNDCGFSGTLSDMTTEKVIIGMIWSTGATRSEIRTRIRKKLAELPGKYDQLAGVIDDKLHPKAVLIPEYPTPMFDGTDGRPAAGCGLFDLAGPMRVDADDAKMVEELGNELNAVIKDAAKRNGWTVATGIADDFKRHGYCSAQSFYVFAEQSCRRQDDLEGTMHPNEQGTRAAAARLSKELNAILRDLATDATAGVRSLKAGVT